MASGLVRDVIERNNNNATPSAPTIYSRGGSSGSSMTGFPAVHHRSKATSAFKRARQDSRVQSELSESREVSTSIPDSNTAYDGSKAGSSTPKPAEDWISEISRSNQEAVEKMDVDERARERQDIIEKFGPGIDDLMAKVREARERRATRLDNPGVQDVPHTFPVPSAPDSLPPSPRSRAARKIRFAEPTEADVHVYESQPSSPKRLLALLPPPEDAQERGDIQSLGSFQTTPKSQKLTALPHSSHDHTNIESPEEGTPEDIRRRFFPSEMPPEANPALAWMLPSSASSSGAVPHSAVQNDSLGQRTDVGSTQEPRYSLSGIRLSPAQISSLPTHLGLHHHAASSASDALAGYTLSDLLLLSRSSVPAQRASMLTVLAKLLKNTREKKPDLHHTELSSPQFGFEEGLPSAIDDVNLDALRRDLVDAAIDALDQRGGVGQHGVELLWEAVVGFIHLDYGVMDLKDLANVDLTPKTASTRSSTSSTATTSFNSETHTLNSSKPPSDVVLTLPVATILPMLRHHLIASPEALSRTHTQVLEILLVLSHFASHAKSIVNLDGVVAAMLEPHLRSSFGSNDSEGMYATPTSILTLQALARSCRDNAVKLTGPADVLLRYITEPRSPPAMWTHSAGHSSFRVSIALLEETLRFYDVLSQYGLYSQIATIAQQDFMRIGVWILDAMRITGDASLASLLRSYVNLLGVLTICATDPHQTMPSHDILWSQVQGWGWTEWIMEAAELVADVTRTSSSLSLENTATYGVWADLFNTAAALMEGASINGVKSGESERSTILSRLGPLLRTGCGAWQVVAHAIASLRAWTASSMLDFPDTRVLAHASSLLAATTRLAISCLVPGTTESPFHFFEEDIQAFCIRFSSNVSSRNSFSGDYGSVLPETAYTFIKPLTALLFHQLKFWRRSIGGVRGIHAQNEEWTTQAFRVLHVLVPGDEDYAQWISEAVCETVDADFVRKVLPTTDVPQEIWEKDGIKVLIPFLDHSLRPTRRTDGEDQDRSQPTYVAPLSPTPRSISRCTTLMIPCASHLREAWDSNDPDTVLPLRNDWPMLPLNHLLRSGTSSVFHALPSNWDASETDVVRASLLLARIFQVLGGAKDSAGDSALYIMSSAEVIFACMKVFMLEHGQQQLDSGEEVFRDKVVTRWMEDLLKPFTYLHSHDTPRQTNITTSLESVSKAFLGAGTPFYQFYTDFLALYDAISFSHSLFALLLLPPVSMAYPIDYRKLLFGDFAHVLRTVKTAVLDLLCSDVREYLWPVERDAHVIGSFLKSLLTTQVQGAVRWIALHHVAANIWPDFTSENFTSRERAAKLLSAVLQQGKSETVREIILYRQQEDEVWEPPRCFVSGELSWRSARLQWVESVAGERAKELIQNLLLE